MYSREIESAVQMRLFSMSKRHFVILIVLFLASALLSVLIGVVGPPIILSHTITKNYSNFKDKVISESLTSNDMSVFNQQLWLTAKPYTEDSKKIIGELKYRVNIFGYSSRSRQRKVEIFNNTDNFAKRTFTCVAKSCDEVFISHINFITAPFYKFELRITEHHPDFNRIDFVLSSFNTNFSQLEIWFRFSFLVLGFIATVVYNSSLRKFSIRDWSMEQKWVAVLLPGLILYNNPLVPLKFIVDSPVTSVIDTIFQATFVCMLLLFWVTIYHGMREIKRRCISFHCPKVLIISMVWLLIVILPVYQAVRESYDASFYYKLHSLFLVYKCLLLGSLVVYILYTLFLIITACGELRSIPYFGVRIKFFTALMVVVLVFNLIMIYLRFGAGLFNDNFVFERASRYSNSVEFCSQYGIINIYLFTMAYVYSPSKNAIHEANFQDDPNISMVNESDEDVLYGSDVEETTLLSKKNLKAAK